MSKIVIRLAIAVAALLAVACSKPDSFTVRIETADSSETSVALRWFDGSGMASAEGRVIEGHGELRGATPGPTLAWLTDGSGQLLTAFVVSNGDKVKVTADLAEPMKSTVRGADNAEEFARWMSDNAVALARGNADEINAAVADYVGRNPDSPVSTALIAWVFRSAGHELQADSLMRHTGPGARSRAMTASFAEMIGSQLSVDANAILQGQTYPVGGSKRARQFYPREATLSLVAFTGSQAERTDTLKPLFRRLTERYPARRLQILEVSGAADSTEWARAIRADSTAAWTRTWSPIATADRRWRPYAIPDIPFFIVVDSTGTQCLRSRSAADVESFIGRKLGR